MTYLQDATYLSGITGTSSNGVSPIVYGQQWNNLDIETVKIIFREPKSEEPILIDSRFDAVNHLQSYVMFWSNIDTPSWKDAIGFFHQREPVTVYLEPITQNKTHSTFMRMDVPSLFLWRDFTTANIGFEDIYKEAIQNTRRRKISERFEVLAQREDNWDDYNSKKPSELILSYAQSFINELLDQIISAGYHWYFPFISTDEDGYITVEWYDEERELHLLIAENEVEYLQIWGTNIETEMREGILGSDDYLTLWEWLFHV